MVRLIQILVCLTIVMNCYSQNDTLYLEKNQTVWQGKEYNKHDNLGQKTGKWIEFEIDNSFNELTLGSGDGVHFQEEIEFEYRPVNDDEFNGYKKLITEKVDTLDGDLFYDLKFKEVRSKVPPDVYFIKGQGRFENDKKEGHWDYYYRSGVIKKSINYKNGFPSESFTITREDGSLMIELAKKNDGKWIVTKYSKNGVKIETLEDKIENFKILY